jgi:bacterioferritin-associated ferredoxin
MDLDQPVCLCFRVTRRKLLQFLRVQRPRVASQLADCGGAGTGCGWCIPYLQQLFHQVQYGGKSDLECLSLEEYASRRAAYLRTGQREG